VWVLASCGMMVVGFVVASLDGSSLSLLGIVSGGFSSLFQAMYQVSIKQVLPHTDNNSNLLLLYNLLLSSILFLPVIYLSNESAGFHELQFDPNSETFYSSWNTLICSGVLGTLINLATYMCVSATSPLTFNIVGFSKACVQSLGGVVFLGETVGLQSGSGIFLTLLASGWYSRLKLDETRVKAAQVDVAKIHTTDGFDDIELGEDVTLITKSTVCSSSSSHNEMESKG